MMRSRTFLAVILLLSQCDSAGNTSEEKPAATEIEDPRAEMAEVPAGLFVYGTTEEEFDLLIGGRTINFPGLEESLKRTLKMPPQSINLPLFYMDRFEVTNENFHEFVTATGYRPKNLSHYLEHWKGATGFPEWAASFPVVWVSQTDAEAYCSWRGKRLPSEEEWEKAARGDSGARFPWGDVSPTDETANVATDKLEPVGNRPNDCSRYGIYDLAGNVSELTSSMTSGRVGPRAVVRGGCYKCGASEMATFYRRTIRSPEDRAEHIGFRCVAD